MIETIIITLIVARVQGFKIREIKLLFLTRSIYSVIIMALIYIYLEYNVFHGNYYYLRYATIFKTLYFLVFFVIIVIHDLIKPGLIGSAFMVAGNILNIIAVNANNGKMPMFPSFTLKTGYVKLDMFQKIESFDIHVLGNAKTKLWYLTDYIDLGYSLLSPGDVLARMFVFAVLLELIKKLNREAFMKYLGDLLWII